MTFLSSRFSFNKGMTGNQFHSSGIIKGGSVTSGTSDSSFEERARIDANRQTIGAYRNASVTHLYRQEFHESRNEESCDDARKHRKGSRQLSSHSDNFDSDTPQKQGFARTSRIDVAPPSRQAFNAGERVVSPARPTMPARFRPTFDKPRSRGYDPYK